MDYAKFQREHRRLSILRTLNETPGNDANESLLADVLNHVGLKTSHDTVCIDLDWLAEQGLVTVRSYAGLKVAHITKRGIDVATGMAVVSGVQKPSPGE